MKKLMMAAMVAAAAFAATADEWGFTYQAELRNERGGMLPKGIKTVEFRLWDAPADGILLWGRTYNIQTDDSGLFNVALSDDSGSVVTEFSGVTAPTLAEVFSSHAAGGVYVGLTVNGTTGEIAPRQRLYAVPFASTANVAHQLSSPEVPIGGIIMWTKEDLPDKERWAICDGQTKNGITTPDLRGRFIVSTGSMLDRNGNTGSYSYGVGTNSGEIRHKLTVSEMPAHGHELSVGAVDPKDSGSLTGFACGDQNGRSAKYPSSSVGDGLAHENRPPYFALYFIMRVK